ncbi:MAG: Cof-type HAD-IIB family hydrolase [Nocardioides sp.]|nr:Cof-type HAD-IIB family hydrolase [Nocardioides sp.]
MPAALDHVRLVATDLDNTLLREDLTVSPRTRAALDAVRAAGIVVVPVTARQPVGVRHIAEDAGFTEWAVCSNGSLGIHLATGQRLWESTVPVPAQQRLVATLTERVPGLVYVSVRDGGEAFVSQEGYAQLPALTFEDHKRDPATMGSYPLEEVLAAPSLKLIVRHPDLGAAQLYDAITALGLDDVAVTQSGAPFVEVMAAGTSKAWGVQRLCDHLGIAPQEVLAFGDARNDVEMLRWAGRGVAVANAVREAIIAADEVTGSNADDGVAAVLERLL